jgi:hypothetical protein
MVTSTRPPTADARMAAVPLPGSRRSSSISWEVTSTGARPMLTIVATLTPTSVTATK